MFRLFIFGSCQFSCRLESLEGIRHRYLLWQSKQNSPEQTLSVIKTAFAKQIASFSRIRCGFVVEGFHARSSQVPAGCQKV